MGINYIGYSRAVIDSAGHYIIDRDITQTHPSDAAVYVNPGVHNVTLEIRGRIEGAIPANGTSSGIEANGCNLLKIIGSGVVRGFTYGARLENCQMATVKGLLVRDSKFRGIKIEGDYAKVEDCEVLCVTGATWTPNAYCMGIEVAGMVADGNGQPVVQRNLVRQVQGMGSGESVGISVTDKGRGGIVLQNAVLNDVLLAGSWGIWVGGNSVVDLNFNTVRKYINGAAFSSPTFGYIGPNAFPGCTNKIVSNNGENVEILQ